MAKKVKKFDPLRDRVKRLRGEHQSAHDNRELVLDSLLESVHAGRISVDHAWRQLVYADDALIMAARRLTEAENDVRDR